MQSVGSYQERTRELEPLTIGRAYAHRDALGMIAIAGDAHAREDGLRAEPLDGRLMQQHLQLAAMNRILGPGVACEEAARLRVDVVAVEPDQGPFFGRQPDHIERVLPEAEIIELAHGIGLEVDADAERP